MDRLIEQHSIANTVTSVTSQEEKTLTPEQQLENDVVKSEDAETLADDMKNVSM